MNNPDNTDNTNFLINNQIIEAPEGRDEFKRFISNNKDKGIIVYATATWCKPCRTSKPVIFQLFSQLNDPSKILMVMDIDKCRDVSSYLRIRGVPQMTYYDNGEPTHVVKGGSMQQIQAFFQKIM